MSILPIVLDRGSDSTLQDQIFEQMRKLIVAGRLPPRTRIPASRQMASQLGVSRNTVMLAYERLVAEGYLTTRPAAGNFVANALPESAESARPAMTDWARSRLGSAFLIGRPTPRPPRAAIDFGLRSAAHTEFPIKVWRRKVGLLLDHHGDALGSPPPPGGEPRLRRAVASWLAGDRGPICHPDEIIIVSGCQQAYNLAAHLFVRPGDRVVVEGPGHSGADMAFAARGAELIRVPVDEQGLCVESLPDGPVALACVTPSHQNPVGGVLPLDRRRQLIEWARRAGACIFEDDCNGEKALCWDGAPLPSLKALDLHGQVVYAGTFTKTLGAGLRLGYVVVPAEFVSVTLDLKDMFDGGNPWLEQMALASLIESGGFDRHLDDLARRWLPRRDCLIAELRRAFGTAAVTGADAGTHLAWTLPPEAPDAAVVAAAAAAEGIGVSALAGDLSQAGVPARFVDRTLYLNYSSLTEDAIARGIRGLATIINRMSATTALAVG